VSLLFNVKNRDYKTPIKYGISFLLLVGMFLTAKYGFLLFHFLSELFSIVIAYSIYIIVLNSRDFSDDSTLSLFGVVFFFVGSLDMLHTIGYAGMNIFKGYDANLPTQLWIAARYVQSISILIILLLKVKTIRFVTAFILYLVIFIVLVFLIFSEWYPDCFIAGSGLTPFKKISEYVISTILAVSIVILIKNKQNINRDVRKWLLLSLIMTIGSEFMFTFYVSVYGLSNLFGHYLKIASFYFIYKALIETSLKHPYSILFRKLYERNIEIQRNEEKLTEALKEKEMLLKEVYHRTKNNMTVISSLLNLKSGELDDPHLVNIFKDAGNRIVSMALVQEKLYKSGDLSSISLPEYIKELCGRIEESYKDISKDIELKIDIEPMMIETDTAVSIGLIINEILSNSYKYAFTKRPNGEISICYKTIKSEYKELRIIDNGVGISDDLDSRKTLTLGLQLIEMTVRDHLKGTMEIKKENGTGYYIRFKQ
jgi:two-component sensor histidine kinase